MVLATSANPRELAALRAALELTDAEAVAVHDDVAALRADLAVSPVGALLARSRP